MIKTKVLLMDNDAAFLRLLRRIFEDIKAEVVTAGDSIEGMSKLLTYQPDLIVFDIMTPEKDGIRLCRLIRQITNRPLVVLSASHQDRLMLQCLEAGADDFLTRPINPEILLARVTAAMHSEQRNNYYPIYNYNDGNLKVNSDKHRVLIGDEPVKLTPIEFSLLVYLINNEGKVLSFERILFNVWGKEYSESAEYVHVYVSRLRGKIENDTKGSRYIRSIHGVGYMFEGQPYENTSFERERSI